MKNIIRLSFVILTAIFGAATPASDRQAGNGLLRITVVFNNILHAPGLATGWGFAAVIEAEDRQILFDTGADGKILLSNMERLGIDPKAIATVVLSHIHGDHTGGLNSFLQRNPKVTVFVPESFPASFRPEVERHGSRIENVSGPRRLFDHIHSSGELGSDIKEQALIIDTAKGLIVITGCAHPHIAEIAEAARNYLKKDLYLLVGGFHLLNMTKAEILTVIDDLRKLGVQKIAPSHCTGNRAISLFREAWGDDFIEGGCGAAIELSP